MIVPPPTDAIHLPARDFRDAVSMMDEQTARYIAAALRYRHGRRAFVVASHEADLSVLRGDHATAAHWRSVADCLVGAAAGADGRSEL